MRVVPHTPLLTLTALVAIPATTALVYFPEGVWRGAAASGLLLLLLLAVVDLMVSPGRMEGLDLECPETLRCTRGREFSAPFRFLNRGRGDLPWLRFGITLAPEFRAAGEVVRRLGALPAGRAVTAEYELLPLKRGRHFIEACHAESRSLLGLWLVRKSFPVGIEVRVYPDLSVERRQLAGLFLHRGSEGTHAVRQLGKGREFEQLREYQPGDDYADIDWKATARRSKPVTRTYQIERTQEVYAIVDHSRLSAREIRTPIEGIEDDRRQWGEYADGGEFAVTTQLERFLHCSLILASVAERQGDLFGFISFADRVDRFLRSRGGRDHHRIVRDALYTLEPKMVAPDFEQLVVALRQKLTRRALLVMLVDLGDPLTAEQFQEAIPLIGRQHLVLVNMVRPERANPLFQQRRLPRTTTGIYENLSGHFQWNDLQETRKKLGRFGVELGLPGHAELCAETVSQYLQVKKRQRI